MTTERSQPVHVTLPPLTRRGFLGGVGAASLAALATQLATAAPTFATSEGTVLPLVDPLPEGAPDRTLFAPNEQVFAPYLMILSPLANSVVDDDADLFGWMEDGWWRSPNQPYNARIMEHVATLSWFLTHERPWNPYYLDVNLLGRLDAALGYYLGIQREAGYWTEYGWGSESRAATGFGAVSLSATMRDLRDADLLPERQVALEASLRSACAWLVDLKQYFWETPIQATNQTAALLAGVAQTAAVLDDPSIAATLAERCAFMREHGQAPAGFFHEPLSYDAGYNYTVGLPDLAHIYEQTGDPSVLEMARQWVQWAKYVIVLEPGQARGFHVAAFSARNYVTTYAPASTDAADRPALGRAFMPDVPELAAWHQTAEDRAASREDWSVDPAPVSPRKKGDTSPRLHMHVPVAPDGATAAERDAQIAGLPYLAESSFTEVREGTLDQQYVFVRRPALYLAAMYGERPNPRLRMGPALLWHPTAGTLVYSVNNLEPITDDHWGTITTGGVGSALSTVAATHHVGADATGDVIDRADLSGYDGVFTTRYVTEDSAITTDISHWQDGLRRSVTTDGDAIEQIPLVIQAQDEVVLSDGTLAQADVTTEATATGLTLTRGTIRLVIDWGTERTVELAATDRVFFGGASRQAVLSVPFSTSLTTELTTIDLDEVDGDRVAFSVTSQTVQRGGRHLTAIHVVNLDVDPVEIRIASAAGGHTFRDLAPGASGFVELSNTSLVTAPAVAVTRTCGSGRPRVATRRLSL